MSKNDESLKNTETLASSLVQALADRIYSDITEKGLSEGDFFMTVEQVSDEFEVSRTIAREAVSQLRALNILVSRQRKGLLIGRSDPIQVLSRCLRFYSEGADNEELNTLAQLRYILEVGAVDLAVAQATTEQLQQLVDIADKGEALTSNSSYNYKDEDDLDEAFHRQILEMTGNPLIIGMHRVVTDYFHISKEMAHPPTSPATSPEHKLIADAFQRRNSESARSLLRCHLERAMIHVAQIVRSKTEDNKET